MSEGRYDWEAWSDDPIAWDVDTGAPGLLAFGNAVQHWALMQNRTRVTVEEAAIAFNVAPARIVEAVDHHAWMCVQRDTRYARHPARMTIEHDGE